MKKIILFTIGVMGFATSVHATIEPPFLALSMQEEGERLTNAVQTKAASVVTESATEMSNKAWDSGVNYVKSTASSATESALKFETPKLASTFDPVQTVSYLPTPVASELQSQAANMEEVTTYYTQTMLVGTGTSQELTVTTENQRNNAYIAASKSVAVGVEAQANSTKSEKETKEAKEAVAKKDDFSSMNKAMALMTADINNKIDQSKLLQSQLLELNAAETMWGMTMEDMPAQGESSTEETTGVAS